MLVYANLFQKKVHNKKYYILESDHVCMLWNLVACPNKFHTGIKNSHILMFLITYKSWIFQCWLSHSVNIHSVGPYHIGQIPTETDICAATLVEAISLNLRHTFIWLVFTHTHAHTHITHILTHTNTSLITGTFPCSLCI
jgi:hypothetical protein